jgi:hypothetical protein
MQTQIRKKKMKKKKRNVLFNVKFKKLIIDFENKYLQMSLLYNYFHEAKLKCNLQAEIYKITNCIE